LAGSGPVIHRPLEGDEFVMREGVPEEHQQIALLASAESGAGLLHWFVDDTHFWSGPAGVPVLMDPIPGQHRLVAVDQEGRSASVRIRVEP
jgi:membrane carboxypeptidase/penicillin-binding protein PbpC